jgi:hypothetical protein
MAACNRCSVALFRLPALMPAPSASHSGAHPAPGRRPGHTSAQAPVATPKQSTAALACHSASHLPAGHQLMGGVQLSAEQGATCTVAQQQHQTHQTCCMNPPTGELSSGRLRSSCRPCSQQRDVMSPDADGTAAAAIVEQGGQVAEVALQQCHEQGHRVEADQQLPPQPLGAPFPHHLCRAASGRTCRFFLHQQLDSWHRHDSSADAPAADSCLSAPQPHVL